MEVFYMNNLLIFFAFPIAVIIISAILQKLLRNPAIVAALIFAIFIVVAFAAFDETFLIAVLAYTVLAFITALIVSLLCNNDNDDNNCLCNTLAELLQNSNTNTNNVTAALRDLLANGSNSNNTGNANSNNNNSTLNSNNFSNNTNSNNNNSILNSNNFSNNTNSNNNNSINSNDDDDDNVLINNCNCGCGRRFRRF